MDGGMREDARIGMRGGQGDAGHFRSTNDAVCLQLQHVLHKVQRLDAITGSKKEP